MKNSKRNSEPLWSSLEKSWKAFKILKNKKYVHQKTKKLKKIAMRIRNIQSKLGKPKSQFPDLGVVDK